MVPHDCLLKLTLHVFIFSWFLLCCQLSHLTIFVSNTFFTFQLLTVNWLLLGIITKFVSIMWVTIAWADSQVNWVSLTHQVGLDHVGEDFWIIVMLLCLDISLWILTSVHKDSDKLSLRLESKRIYQSSSERLRMLTWLQFLLCRWCSRFFFLFIISGCVTEFYLAVWILYVYHVSVMVLMNFPLFSF